MARKRVSSRRTAGAALVAVCACIASLPAVATPAAVPEAVWTQQFGTATDDQPSDLAADASGAYVVASTQGRIGGAPSGGDDVVVRKYGPGGAVVWTRQFGGAGNDLGNGIAVRQGAVVIGGGTWGGLPGQTAGTLPAAFVRKYDAQGKHLWTRQFSGSAAAVANAVAVSDKGIFVAGAAVGALPDGGGAFGDADAFVARFSANGDHLWTRQLGTGAGDAANGITVTADGVYAAGTTSGTLPGQSSAGAADAFLVGFSHTGDSLWTRQFGTPQIDTAEDIAGGHGGVYVVGGTGGLLGGQQYGLWDAYVRRYSAAGDPVWTRQFGTRGDDDARDIAVYRGSILVSGWLTDTLQGYSDAFVRRYDSSGGSVWVRQFGTDAYDDATGVGASKAGVFVTGRTQGTFASSSAGEFDAYVRRFVSYRPDGAIKRATGGPYAGNDVYNTTGNGQGRSDLLDPGSRRTFIVRVQNDGDVPDRYLIQGCASSGPFTVVYRDAGGTKISDPVAAGTYRTASIAPGAVTTLRVAITAAESAPAGRVKTCATTVTSNTRSVMTDVVKAKVTVSPPGG